jgi:hypothetical protein
MTGDTAVRRYRLIIETDAIAFAEVDELLTTLEAALDAERRHGEVAVIWLEDDPIYQPAPYASRGIQSIGPTG